MTLETVLNTFCTEICFQVTCFDKDEDIYEKKKEKKSILYVNSEEKIVFSYPLPCLRHYLLI